MSLENQFMEAKERVTKLPERPDNASLLELYALYKQSTEGDVLGKKPGMLDFVAKAKYEVWETKKGLSKDQAMDAYIKLVKNLEAKK